MNAVLLRDPNYRAYAGAGVATSLGTWLQKTALAWHLYRVSGSAEMLALLALADALPFVLVSLHAGAAADAVTDKIRAWRFTYAAQAAVFAALVIALALDDRLAWPMFAAVAASSLLSTLSAPLSQHAIRRCFDAGAQASMASTASLINNVSRFVGAWLGAVCYARLGVVGVVALNAASFLVPYWQFRRLRPISAAEPPRKTGPGEVAAGLRHVAADRLLRSHFALLLVTCLLGRPIVEQISAIASLSARAGVDRAAALLSAVAVGAIAAGAVLPALHRRRSPLRLSLWGAALLALATSAVGLSIGSRLQPAAFALLGFAMVSHGASLITHIQRSVPTAFLGRVSSLFNLILRGGVAVGALALGWAGDRGATVPALFASAAAILVAMPPAWAAGRTASTVLPRRSDVEPRRPT